MHICIDLSMPVSKLSHNLARFRHEHGLSQADVAKLVGCARITIQSVERGLLDLSPKLAAKVQGALGIPAGWLILNDLSTPVPEPLRIFQEGNLPHKAKFTIMVHLAQAFKILDLLPNDPKAFALFDHYAFKFWEILGKNFGANYPALNGFKAIDYISKSVEAFKAQRPADLPRRSDRKAKHEPRKERSRNRQSA